jgi:23S rRNA (uracil1939-C5)-methyltransferase
MIPEDGTSDVIVRVNGIAVGGSAVGRVVGPEDATEIGMAAFLPFAAPGETILATVTKRQERFLEASVKEIQEASPDRVVPRCPYFGECGGCDLQHLSYPAQRQAKREMVTGAFRSAKFGDSVIDQIEPVVASPPYGYRQRIILHVDSEGKVGYYQRKSHTVLPITQCPISTEPIDRLLAEGLSFSDYKAAVGAELHVESGENGLFCALRLARRIKPNALISLQAFLETKFAGGVVSDVRRLLARFGATDVIRRVHGITMISPPGGFSQANATVNDALVTQVCDFAREKSARTALDLYAGAGNFALALASDGLRVTAVEVMGDLVAAGQTEANRRGLTDQAGFLMTSVEDYFLQRTQPVDLVVADPPRGGLGKIASRLNFCKSLCLVSCHLPSAVRDIRTLTESGWRIERIIPFDMFPQTAYVELLTIMTHE